jgi:hypothetical protein
VAERKVGELLDSLNTTLDVDDADMVTDVVVLAKIVLPDGRVSIGIGKSESTTWLDQLGLVYAAGDIIRNGDYATAHGDGDEGG